MIVAVHLPLLPLRVAMMRAGRPPDMAAALAPEPGAPQVVGMCTPAAGAEGVREGLRVGEAYARCPHLALIPPHPEGAIAVAQQLMAALEDAGCAVEALDEHTVALESGPLLRLHGGLGGVLARVRRSIPLGTDGRIGVAPTLCAARHAALAAHTGAPLVIGPDRVTAFLAPMPVEALGLPAAACRRCRDLGLTTVGHIAALPRAAALERLGAAGAEAHRIARGGADRPLRPRTPARPLSAGMGFGEPVGALGALESAARVLLDEIGARAGASGRAVRTLTLVADLADGGSWARRVALRDATADPDRLCRSALPHLAGIPSPAAALRVDADASAAPAGHQLTALPSPRQERMARSHEAARQVRSVLGDGVLLRVVALDVDSHIPERRWALAVRSDEPPPRGR